MAANLGNIFYAHSGGVTPTINAIAAEIISQINWQLSTSELQTQLTNQQLNNNQKQGRVIVGRNGLAGLLEQELIDTSDFSAATVLQIKNSPASAFGSARLKLPDPEVEPKIFAKILKILKAHNITSFIYNGGNDSQDTSEKLARYCQQQNYPLNIIGIPKTIDNDLATTDICPGYPSTARYLALAMHEASLDLASMCKTSTKVFVMEVMGRHSGWLAAATCGAKQHDNQGPHIVLIPEIAFEQEKFLNLVNASVTKYGYCCIAASEGICNSDGSFITANTATDAFGHHQLGGVAPYLANLVEKTLDLKTHSCIVDYLQRAARHHASQLDLEIAEQLAKHAINAIINNDTGIMLSIKQQQFNPHQWSIEPAPLADVANLERKLPDNYYDRDKMFPTAAFMEYITPLINRVANLDYARNGWPNYVSGPFDPNIQAIQLDDQDE